MLLGIGMNFVLVATFFEKIEQVSSRVEKTKLLAELLDPMTAQEASIITYLALGDLGPVYKNIQFQIADKGLIDIIASLVHVTVQEIDQAYKNVGDLGLVIETYWKGVDQGLTIEQVYDRLILIAKIIGVKSTELKLVEFVQLLSQLDQISAKYLIRIVTKSLRLGFSDMTLIDAFSWMVVGNKSLQDDLEYAYNVCADLGLVIAILKKSGIEKIRTMVPQVGIPIRPAAAERCSTAEQVIERLGMCVAQPKLDGFRLQIHLDKRGAIPIVHFYSRNLIDMSGMFPDIVQQIIQLPVESLICEGEAIGYQESTDTFLQFQETVRRKRKHNIDQVADQIPLRIYLFDILLLDAVSMLELTHRQRRLELEKITNSLVATDVFIIDEKLVHTSHELNDYFLETIGAGLEGLVIKKIDARYQPGKRNFNWIKLKRSTGQKLGDTIDAVILGYYIGQGKRSNFGIGAFLVGVYNQQNQLFESIAKIGTGMTDLEFIDCKLRADHIAVQSKPANVSVAKSLWPDVWTYPEIVCEIRADDITQSPLHTAGKTEQGLGYALRFPRFVRYRNDKSVLDATTSDEVAHLYQIQYQALS